MTTILKCSKCGAFFEPRIRNGEIDIWCRLCQVRAQWGKSVA